MRRDPSPEREASRTASIQQRRARGRGATGGNPRHTYTAAGTGLLGQGMLDCKTWPWIPWPWIPLDSVALDSAVIAFAAASAEEDLPVPPLPKVCL